jgi:hypothetical protein
VSLLDEPEAERARRRRLDDRIANLGYPVAYRHVEGCEVGLRPRVRCTCRQVVAAREARRRLERERLLSR